LVSHSSTIASKYSADR